MVEQLVKKLQREAYREDRVSLYNQDGIGLHFALRYEDQMSKGE